MKKKVLIIITILGLILITIGFKTTSKKSIYSYQTTKDSPYQVILKPNDLYPDLTLPSGHYYLSSSIKSLKINFKYHFKSLEPSNIKYTYNISSKLIGSMKDDNLELKNIWFKNFTLVPNISKKNIKNSFDLEKQISIDLDFYNNLVALYEKTYNVSISANLKVFLNISYEINSKNLKNKIIKDQIELVIPLTDNITEVKENYTKKNNQTIEKKNNNIFNFYNGIGLLLVIYPIILGVIKITKNDMSTLNIKNILKKYNDLIVTVTNKPNISNLKIMFLKNFDDLVIVANQNQTNIINYKVSNKQNNLYVIVQNYIYIYKITTK